MSLKNSLNSYTIKLFLENTHLKILPLHKNIGNKN